MTDIDPNGNIYEDLDYLIPTEDKARLDGYRRGLSASDDDMAIEVNRLRLDLARADVAAEDERRARDLSDALRIESENST